MSEEDAFGFYLSGLVDGEGHFQVAIIKSAGGFHPRIEFNIALRSDDCDILNQIKNLWGCGSMHYSKVRQGRDGCVRRPLTRYYVSNLRDVINTAIPFFEKYPLRAKKKRDYELWKEAAFIVNSRLGSKNDPKLLSKVSEVIKKMKAIRKPSIKMEQLNIFA